MKLTIKAAAFRDYVEAYGYYYERSPAVAGRFEAEVESILDQIERHPRLFPEILPNVRVAVGRDFSYRVVFRMRVELEIIAIYHAKRDPERLTAR